MLFVLAVFQEGDRFVGRHHITELLDHIPDDDVNSIGSESDFKLVASK